MHTPEVFKVILSALLIRAELVLAITGSICYLSSLNVACIGSAIFLLFVC